MEQILAYDSCFSISSVALKNDEGVVTTIESGTNTFENLVPTINTLTKGASVEKILLTIGPGSFTGIRIGIATAFGIQAVTKAKILGCSTFDLFITQFLLNNKEYVDSKEKIVVVLEAKRKGLVYFQKTDLENFYNKDSRSDEKMLLPIDELKNHAENTVLITNIKNIYDSDFGAKRKFYIEKTLSKTLFDVPENRLIDTIKPIYFS